MYNVKKMSLRKKPLAGFPLARSHVKPANVQRLSNNVFIHSATSEVSVRKASIIVSDKIMNGCRTGFLHS